MNAVPNFSKTLIDWFEENQRALPWRGETDAYKIWVSEIILQQTRVNQGWNYYLRFTERFPNIESLAKATLQEILHIWQGLGYYSRARNMHTAAQQIMQKHGGAFPNNYLEIKNLKGIGNYTAAAIASIAFQLPYPAVDGNVLRVISRIFGIYDDISQQKTVQTITKLCLDLMDKKNAGSFNQALMELGAIQCTPKNPKCDICPFATQCIAFTKEHQTLLPVKSIKAKIKERYFHYFIFLKEGKTIIEQRVANDIWKNLYQFTLIETEMPCDISVETWRAASLQTSRIASLPLGKSKPVFLKEIKHKLTHQHLTIRFYVVNDFFPKTVETQCFASLQPIPVEDLENYPFPVAIGKIVEKLGRRI